MLKSFYPLSNSIDMKSALFAESHNWDLAILCVGIATLQLVNVIEAVKNSKYNFFLLKVPSLLLVFFYFLSSVIVDIRNYMWIKFSLQFLPKIFKKPFITVKLCGLGFFLYIKTKQNTNICFIFSRIPTQK